MKIISTQCTARFCLKMELHILKNIKKFSHSQYNSNRKEWLCFLKWGEKDAVKI